MSAFVVGKAHIDALVTAGLHLPGTFGPLRWFDPAGDTASGEPSLDARRELTRKTAGRVGAMLWAENVRSVNYRYTEDEWEEVYLFTELRSVGLPDPVQVLKAIAGYVYQSCEHPEWRTSEARRFCDALRHAAIRNLPGYDAAEWAIDSPDVFLNVRPRQA